MARPTDAPGGSLLPRFPHVFADQGLLRMALSHRSHSAQSNAQLEWLGDSILNMVVSLYLYRRFPGMDSGELSQHRSRLVDNQTLHGIAIELGLPAEIRIATRSPELRTNPTVLSDALEALIGATYLDGGYHCAESTVFAIYGGRLESISREVPAKNPKSLLNERLQALSLAPAVYRLEEDLDTEDTKHVSCVVDGRTVAIGRGPNRAAAEIDVALAALAALEKDAGE